MTEQAHSAIEFWAVMGSALAISFLCGRCSAKWSRIARRRKKWAEIDRRIQMGNLEMSDREFIDAYLANPDDFTITLTKSEDWKDATDITIHGMGRTKKLTQLNSVLEGKEIREQIKNDFE